MLNRSKSTITYTYNSGDQLIKSTDSVWGVMNYTYDKNGNLINEQTGYKVLSYGYTDENRLKSVKQNGVLLMAALYGGNGDRVFSINRYGMENNIVPIWNTTILMTSWTEISAASSGADAETTIITIIITTTTRERAILETVIQELEMLEITATPEMDRIIPAVTAEPQVGTAMVETVERAAIMEKAAAGGTS